MTLLILWCDVMIPITDDDERTKDNLTLHMLVSAEFVKLNWKVKWDHSKWKCYMLRAGRLQIMYGCLI